MGFFDFLVGEQKLSKAVKMPDAPLQNLTELQKIRLRGAFEDPRTSQDFLARQGNIRDIFATRGQDDERMIRETLDGDLDAGGMLKVMLGQRNARAKEQRLAEGEALTDTISSADDSFARLLDTLSGYKASAFATQQGTRKMVQKPGLFDVISEGAEVYGSLASGGLIK